MGFYKKDSGKASITWPQSVDEALCFGWIDGIRQSIDDVSYKIRFTPRKPRSIWSAVNIRRAGELSEQGLMQAAGLKAFAAREENRSGIYSYEQRSATAAKWQAGSSTGRLHQWFSRSRESKRAARRCLKLWRRRFSAD